MTTPFEQLKETKYNISALQKSEQAIREQIASTIEVTAKFQKASGELETAKAERKAVLGQVHLGKNPDLAYVDKAVHAAKNRVESLADLNDGAEAARQSLESELEGVLRDASSMLETLPKLQYEAALAEAETLFDSYIEASNATERKLAEVAGALMTLEPLRNPDNHPVRAWRWDFSMQIEYPEFPLMNRNKFQGFRSHMRVLPAANDAKVKFNERLAKLGII